jgi:hypothetical protein
VDPRKRRRDHITETQQQYNLKERSRMLDAPVEKVRLWLEEEGITPVSEDQPEVYRSEVLEILRGRDHMV